MLRLIITEPAKQDIQGAFQWWSDNRSKEQADKWYCGINRSIRALPVNPDRYSLAPEADLLLQGMRQLHFGIGRRPTHRIVFTITEDAVVVLRVRHSSQDDLRPEDLP